MIKEQPKAEKRQEIANGLIYLINKELEGINALERIDIIAQVNASLNKQYIGYELGKKEKNNG
ncbi:MAG: hypothetical protein ACTSSK_03590 [Candidatus Heimdallarchaeota archaeon]